MIAKELLDVNISEIEADPHNPKKVVYDEHLEELTNSIRAGGIKVPLLGYKLGNGKIGLVDGHRRVAGGKAAKLEKVPIIVWNERPAQEDMFITQVICNGQRTDLSPMELLDVFERLLADPKWNQARLSDEIGKSKTTVSKVMGTSVFGNEERTLIDKHKVSLDQAYELARYPADIRRRKLLELINSSSTRRERRASQKANGAKPQKTHRFRCTLPNQESVEILSSSPLAWDLVQLYLKDAQKLCQKAESDSLDLTTAMQVFKDRAKGQQLKKSG